MFGMSEKDIFVVCTEKYDKQNINTSYKKSIYGLRTLNEGLEGHYNKLESHPIEDAQC